MYGERDYQVYCNKRKLLHKKQDLFGISTWHHGKRSIPMKPFNILCLLPLVSLAWISSETYNLQRVFRPGKIRIKDQKSVGSRLDFLHLGSNSRQQGSTKLFHGVSHRKFGKIRKVFAKHDAIISTWIELAHPLWWWWQLQRRRRWWSKEVKKENGF